MTREFHWLLYAWPRDRDSGALDPGGFWSGEHNRSFAIDGDLRQYAGAGALLEVSPITAKKGSNAMQYDVTLGITDPAVEHAIRILNPRLAEVELHNVEMDHATGAVIGIEREIKGRINGAPIEESAAGLRDPKVTAICTLSIFSSAIDGTVPLESKISDGTQRRVDPGDAGRQYADVSGSVSVAWMGESDNSFTVRNP